MSCSTKIQHQTFTAPWVERNDNFPTSATGLFSREWLLWTCMVRKLRLIAKETSIASCEVLDEKYGIAVQGIFVIKASAASLKVTDLLLAFAFCENSVNQENWCPLSLAVCCLLISINKFSELFRPAVKQQHNERVLTLRAVVSSGRTLRFDGKETSASNRLLFHRACTSTWWPRISNQKTATRTSTKQ